MGQNSSLLPDVLGSQIDFGRRKVTIRSHLSEGGMAHVFLVEDVDSKQKFALKRMFVAKDNHEMHRIAKWELELNNSMPSNSNIVKFIDSKTVVTADGDVEYLLLFEYCNGGSLLNIVERGVSMSFHEILTCFANICSAVAHLHLHDPPITHRDLKLENILLHESGVFKLCDLGSSIDEPVVFKSKAELSNVEENIQKFTTTIYRAPEMCDLYSFGQQMDTKVDIWALGCIFYSLLYLKSPFATGSNVQIISGKYTIPERPRYSRPVHELLQSMLTVNPAKRANIAEVIQRLSGLLVANNISTSVLPRIRPAAPTSAAPTAPPKDSPTSLAASVSASASEHYSSPQLRKTNSDPFPTPEPWDADFGADSSADAVHPTRVKSAPVATGVDDLLSYFPSSAAVGHVSPSLGAQQHSSSSLPSFSLGQSQAASAGPNASSPTLLMAPAAGTPAAANPSKLASKPSSTLLLAPAGGLYARPATSAATGTATSSSTSSAAARKSHPASPVVGPIDPTYANANAAAFSLLLGSSSSAQPSGSSNPQSPTVPNSHGSLPAISYAADGDDDEDESSSSRTRSAAPVVPPSPQSVPEAESGFARYLRGIRQVAQAFTGSSIDKWIIKTTDDSLTEPKPKYVRKLIIESWEHNGLPDFFEFLNKRPVLNNGVVAMKALETVHKLLHDGAPAFLSQAFFFHPALGHLERTWQRLLSQSQGSEPLALEENASSIELSDMNRLLADMICCYAAFLQRRILLHRQFPAYEGNFALSVFMQRLHNEGYTKLRRPAFFADQMQACRMLIDLISRCNDFGELCISRTATGSSIPMKLIEFRQRFLVLVIDCLHAMFLSITYMLALLSRMESHGVVVDNPHETLAALVQSYQQQYLRMQQLFNAVKHVQIVADMGRVITLPKGVPDPAKGSRAVPPPSNMPKLGTFNRTLCSRFADYMVKGSVNTEPLEEDSSSSASSSSILHERPSASASSTQSQAMNTPSNNNPSAVSQQVSTKQAMLADKQESMASMRQLAEAVEQAKNLVASINRDETGHPRSVATSDQPVQEQRRHHQTATSASLVPSSASSQANRSGDSASSADEEDSADEESDYDDDEAAHKTSAVVSSTVSAAVAKRALSRNRVISSDVESSEHEPAEDRDNMAAARLVHRAHYTSKRPQHLNDNLFEQLFQGPVTGAVISDGHFQQQMTASSQAHVDLTAANRELGAFSHQLEQAPVPIKNSPHFMGQSSAQQQQQQQQQSVGMSFDPLASPALPAISPAIRQSPSKQSLINPAASKTVSPSANVTPLVSPFELMTSLPSTSYLLTSHPNPSLIPSAPLPAAPSKPALPNAFGQALSSALDALSAQNSSAQISPRRQPQQAPSMLHSPQLPLPNTSAASTPSQAVQFQAHQFDPLVSPPLGSDVFSGKFDPESSDQLRKPTKPAFQQPSNQFDAFDLQTHHVQPHTVKSIQPMSQASAASAAAAALISSMQQQQQQTRNSRPPSPSPLVPPSPALSSSFDALSFLPANQQQQAAGASKPPLAPSLPIGTPSLRAANSLGQSQSVPALTLELQARAALLQQQQQIEVGSMEFPTNLMDNLHPQIRHQLILQQQQRLYQQQQQQLFNPVYPQQQPYQPAIASNAGSAAQYGFMQPQQNSGPGWGSVYGQLSQQQQPSQQYPLQQQAAPNKAADFDFFSPGTSRQAQQLSGNSVLSAVATHRPASGNNNAASGYSSASQQLLDNSFDPFAMMAPSTTLPAKDDAQAPFFAPATIIQSGSQHPVPHTPPVNAMHSHASSSHQSPQVAAFSFGLSGAASAAVQQITGNHPVQQSHPRQVAANTVRVAASSSSDVLVENNQADDDDGSVEYKDLQFGDRIGIGAFAEVFKGKFHHEEVAIKRLLANQTEDSLQEFWSEVGVMRLLRHQNIVAFKGACQQPAACVVTELLQGNLWDLLHNSRTELPFRLRLHMLQDAARGMEHLHAFNPPIVHRDLKSANLLYDRQFHIKVGDFGLSRAKEVQYTMTGQCGTFQWMSPEVMQSQRYTEKADIFSFGIILWEVLFRQVPYAGMNSVQVSIAVITQNLRPPIPSDTPVELSRLMQECWATNPAQRPTFTEIIDRLVQIERKYCG